MEYGRVAKPETRDPKPRVLLAHEFGQRFPPGSHGRQADFFGEQTAKRRITGTRGDALHIPLMDDLDQPVDLAPRDAAQVARFQRKLVVRTNAGVDDVVNSVAAFGVDFYGSVDQILHIGCA
jgi:hypothetical protein